MKTIKLPRSRRAALLLGLAAAALLASSCPNELLSQFYLVGKYQRSGAGSFAGYYQDPLSIEVSPDGSLACRGSLGQLFEYSYEITGGGRDYESNLSEFDLLLRAIPGGALLYAKVSLSGDGIYNTISDTVAFPVGSVVSAGGPNYVNLARY